MLSVPQVLPIGCYCFDGKRSDHFPTINRRMEEKYTLYRIYQNSLVAPYLVARQMTNLMGDENLSQNFYFYGPAIGFSVCVILSFGYDTIDT